MTERMVEVAWEDSAGTSGWQREDNLPHPSLIRSMGYVRQDDEEMMLLVEAFSENVDKISLLGNATAIPRSAIRHVWELRRKR